MKTTGSFLLLAIVTAISCVDPESTSVIESPGTIPTCTSGTWCTETAPVAGVLMRRVWAASADDVYAVGDDGNIWHRHNGEDWVTMSSGISADLRGIWGTSPSNIWVTGSAGTLLHYDGGSWSTSTAISTTSNLNAVWMSDANNIWVVGGSKVWRSSNAGSSFTSTNLAGILLDVHGSSASQVWVVGENSKARRWNGTSWATIDPGSGSTYFSVLVLASNNLHVARLATGTRKFTSSWATITATGAVFSDMHAQSASDLWGVGGTKVGRYTGSGSAWTVTSPLGGSVAIQAVTGAPNNVWIVGSNSLIAHYAY